MENWIPLVLRNILMKDAMKGVFPSSEPKALVRTEAGHTLFYFLFFFFFSFWKMGVVPGMAMSICVLKMHSEEKVLCGFGVLNSPPCLWCTEV